MGHAETALPPSSSALVSAVSGAFLFTEACKLAGIHDPAEIVPLARYAQMAELRESALQAFRRAKARHQTFAQTHDSDDPAHEDHQRSVTCAHGALISAELALAIALAEWRKARGL